MQDQDGQNNNSHIRFVASSNFTLTVFYLCAISDLNNYVSPWLSMSCCARNYYYYYCRKAPSKHFRMVSTWKKEKVKTSKFMDAGMGERRINKLEWVDREGWKRKIKLRL